VYCPDEDTLQDRLAGPVRDIFHTEAYISSQKSGVEGTYLKELITGSHTVTVTVESLFLGIRVSASSVLYCVFTYRSINISFIYQPLEIVL
jgi:hypothetical protein